MALNMYRYSLTFDLELLCFLFSSDNMQRFITSRRVTAVDSNDSETWKVLSIRPEHLTNVYCNSGTNNAVSLMTDSSDC